MVKRKIILCEAIHSTPRYFILRIIKYFLFRLLNLLNFLQDHFLQLQLFNRIFGSISVVFIVKSVFFEIFLLKFEAIKEKDYFLIPIF